MRALESLVSPTVLPGYKPMVVCPALSLLAFSGFVPVTIEPNPPGPNNVGEAKDGKNPAGQEALSSLKDVLATGSYKHPVHGWSLDVTPDKMKAYCAAFSEMKNAGVKVPIYADHKPGAATTLGYCRDMFMGGPDAIKNHPELAKLPADQAPLDPNKMYAIHDWASPEAQKMGHGVGQVSVLIDKKMKDGTGKSYGEAVRHIAVTPEPIVPGQGSFTQLAASLLEFSNVALYGDSSKMNYELFNPYHDEGGRFTDEGGGKGDHATSAAHMATAEHGARGGDGKDEKAAKLHTKAANQAGVNEKEKAYHAKAAQAFKSGSSADHHAAAKAARSAAMRDVSRAHQNIGATAQGREDVHESSRLSRLVSPAILELSKVK